MQPHTDIPKVLEAILRPDDLAKSGPACGAVFLVKIALQKDGYGTIRLYIGATMLEASARCLRGRLTWCPNTCHSSRLSYAQCNKAWRWRGRHRPSPVSQARRS